MEIKNVKLIFDGKIADNAVDITVENGKISKFLITENIEFDCGIDSFDTPDSEGYKIVDYYTITDIPDTAKYVFAFGWSYRRPPQGTLGVGRLLKTEVISYVETTTAIIIKIEGNTIWWNGEPYTVVTEKEVYLEFIPSK